MFVEGFLHLLLSAAQRSKWGLLCVIVGSVLLCGILIMGLVSTVGNVILVATGTKPVLEFLGSGLGILITAVIAIVLVFVGVTILWFLKPPRADRAHGAESPPSPPPSPSYLDEIAGLRKKLTKAEQKIEELQIELNNRPPRHFNTPVGVVETLTPAKAKEIQQLKSENEELKTQLAEAQQTIQSQRKAMENEHGVVDWGSFPVRQIPVGVDAAPLRAENDKLREELQQTKQELEVSKAGERRKRIEKWQAEIYNASFERTPLGDSPFTATNTYQDMKPWLLDHVRDRFDSPIQAQRLYDLARKKPSPSDKDVLLGEVARIEKEWGVI